LHPDYIFFSFLQNNVSYKYISKTDLSYNYNTEQNSDTSDNRHNRHNSNHHPRQQNHFLAQPVPTAGTAGLNYLRCWRCDYDDADQCVKSFDFTKHKPEACDGKCLKAFEKVEARTKLEIEKAQSNFEFFWFRNSLFTVNFKFDVLK
jgi:hypothetical protein